MSVAKGLPMGPRIHPLSALTCERGCWVLAPDLSAQRRLPLEFNHCEVREEKVNRGEDSQGPSTPHLHTVFYGITYKDTISL